MISLHAEVAKLVYALALGASGVTHGGSSPLLGTEFNDKDLYIRDVATLRLLELPSDKRLSRVEHIENQVQSFARIE